MARETIRFTSSYLEPSAPVVARGVDRVAVRHLAARAEEVHPLGAGLGGLDAHVLEEVLHEHPGPRGRAAVFKNQFSLAELTIRVKMAVFERSKLIVKTS